MSYWYNFHELFKLFFPKKEKMLMPCPLFWKNLEVWRSEREKGWRRGGWLHIITPTIKWEVFTSAVGWRVLSTSWAFSWQCSESLYHSVAKTLKQVLHRCWRQHCNCSVLSVMGLQKREGGGGVVDGMMQKGTGISTQPQHCCEIQHFC